MFGKSEFVYFTLTDERGGCFTRMHAGCNVDHLLLLSFRAVQVVGVSDGQQIQATLLLKDTEGKLPSSCAVTSLKSRCDCC